MTKIATNGSIIIYSTIIGGNGDDYGYFTVLNPIDNSIVLYGHTNSRNFPVVNAYQNVYRGGDFDMFLCHFIIDTPVVNQSSTVKASIGFDLPLFILVFSFIRRKKLKEA